MAVIGVRGQGCYHVAMWAGMPDVEVAAICDVDSSVIGEAMDTAEEKAGRRPRYERDLRRIMEDKSIE
jgi:hypothetical protein